MYDNRALSVDQFIRSGIDTSDYKFITTEGTFRVVLDLKVWGHKMLKNFLTLEDGRKIIACTFSLEKYMGMAEIPLGTQLELTFKKAKRSGSIYIRGVRVLDEECPTP